MAGRQRDAAEIERAAGAIDGLLLRVVAATLTERSPEPARVVVGEFMALDRRSSPETVGGPAQLMGMLSLVRRLSLVREALAERPDRVDAVLGWIEEALGRRYRARARYTSGVLESAAGAGDISTYRPALQDEFLPTLIWLLAGAVAVYGAGDPAWLEALEAGQPSTTGFFTGATPGKA